MHGDQPGHLGGVERSIDIEERFQHVDRRDRNNRRQQLLLQPGEVDLGDPYRPVRLAAGIDTRHEILIAGKHHDQNEVADQDNVDQGQHVEDGVGRLGAGRVQDEVPQHPQELEEEHGEADDKSDIERQHQPAAGEQHVLQHASDALQHGVGPGRSRLLGHRVFPAPRTCLTPPFSWS